MRLSVVFELLLVFLFLAFAAARVIDKKNVSAVSQNAKKLRQGGPNRYCACTTNMCNCCRDFSLPVVPVKGPGCASIMYLKGDNMMISMSFGERVLSNMTIAGPKPKPVCMTLPGGISQFCGRIYGISRTEKNFKACLGLELRALDDIEAALRVSCFKFGPKGVNLESAPPIPPDETKEPDEEDEDEDDDYDLDDEEDDDIIGLGDDLDDDDDDDDDDDEGTNAVSGGEGNEVDSDSVDYAGFSVLGEDFFGTFFSDEPTRPKKKKGPVRKTVKPVTPALKLSSTTRRPILPIKRPTLRPNKVTRKPAKVTKIPRPFITKIVPTSTSPSTTPPPEEVSIPSIPPVPVSIPPLPHVSLTPVNIPVKPSTTVVTEAVTLNDVKYVTTEKLPTSASEESSPAHLPESTEKLNNQQLDVTEKVTQSPTLVKVTLPNDEVKLPDLDVEKIEAIAAIAQQGVTSSVIHSSALPAEETEKLSISNEVGTEEVRTEKYVPTVSMFKAGSKGSEEEEEEEDDDDLLDGIIDDGISNNENDDDDDEDGDDDDTDSEELQTNNVSHEESNPTKVQVNATSEKEKDPVGASAETEQPIKVKPPEKVQEEEDEEEENEDNDDFFDGIIDDDDDDDDDEEEEDEKKKGDEEGEEETVKEEEEEEDILGAFVSDSDNEQEENSGVTEKDKEKESDEESEEEEDILSVLGGDDESEDTAAEEEDDEDNKPTLKNKTGTTQLSIESDHAAEAAKPDVTLKADTSVKSTTDEHNDSNSSGSSGSSSEEDKKGDGNHKPLKPAVVFITGDEPEKTNVPTTVVPEAVSASINSSESGRFGQEPIFPLTKSDTFLVMKAATKLKEPQALKLSDIIGLPKKYPPERSDKPISTSRTHRRMNLDRMIKQAQVSFKKTRFGFRRCQHSYECLHSKLKGHKSWS